MTMYETIFKRKSTIKYDMAGLSSAELTEIETYKDSLKGHQG